MSKMEIFGLLVSVHTYNTIMDRMRYMKILITKKAKITRSGLFQIFTSERKEKNETEVNKNPAAVITNSAVWFCSLNTSPPK